MTDMERIEIKAPAKVNTFLKVVGRRPNGYHDLQMVMVPLSLADDIQLEKTDGPIEFRLDGDGDAGMQGGKNLCFRAAELLCRESGVSCGVRITLKKNTPIAAGLGGGSSDAAGVLKGLNVLWAIDWPKARLAELGGRLGADCPFFCYDGPALVEGIGDKVTPYKNFPNISFLLVNPGFSVSTPWVYGQWDLQHAPNAIEGLTGKPRNVRSRPHFQAVSDVATSLHNDLEEVTVRAYPILAEIKEKLLKAGAVGSLMSGSGPTVFGVFASKDLRDRAVRAISRDGWRIFPADSIGV